MLAAVGCTSAKDRAKAKETDVNKMVIFDELVGAYSAAIVFYAENARIPSSLVEAKFKQSDRDVVMSYKPADEGFVITASLGDYKMSIDNKKRVFDKDMQATEPVNPEKLKQAPEAGVIFRRKK